MAGKKPIEEDKLAQVTGGVGGIFPESDVETTSEMRCEQSETGYHIIKDYSTCICERCNKKVQIRNTSGGIKA